MTDIFGTSLFAASAAIFGPLAGWLAARRGRNPVTWLIFGALIGPLAAGLLAIAPPGRCAFCDAKTRGWPAACQVCGLPFGAARAWPGPGLEAGARASLDDTPGPRAAPALETPVAPRRGTPRTVGRPLGPRQDTLGAEVVTSEILATGVYFGGSTGLVPGARYAIVRHGASMRLLGPLDQDPAKVAYEHPLDRLVATAIGDRLLMSESSPGGVAIAMGVLAGRRADQVEAELVFSGSTLGSLGAPR